MSKHRISQNGYAAEQDLQNKLEKDCTPVMQARGVEGFVKEVWVYPKDQLKSIGLVEITKSLSSEEIPYLIQEYHRINRDPERLAAIGYNRGSYVLFVNDLTEGEFEKLENAML